MSQSSRAPQSNQWTLENFQGWPELRRASDKPGTGVRADWQSLRLPDGVNSLRNQPLGRAVGKDIRTALDATAGLGFDSYAMALLEIDVLAWERDATIFALLESELSHAMQYAKAFDEKIAAANNNAHNSAPERAMIAAANNNAHNSAPERAMIAAAARIRIEHADALVKLSTLHLKPDLILLDPMFGATRGAAKPSKAMQALAATVGGDLDADALLAPAINAATQRVIVKRARLAPPLAAREPDWCVKGKLLRFDVYRGRA